MELYKLDKTTDRPAKRVGRGIGSGKGGHTSGRGSKGQKARGQVKIGFEGTKTKKSFVKKLPFLRGKGKFKAWGEKPTILKTGDLALWPESMPVDIPNLIKKGLVSKDTKSVKILGGGEAPKKLEIKVLMSGKVKKRYE